MLAAMVCCVNPGNGAMAQTCQMSTAILAKEQVGPLKLEILGAPMLCIAPEGDANLAPFTATARITNSGAAPVTVTYTKGATPAFRSTGIWIRGLRHAAQFFQQPEGEANNVSRVAKTLAPGDSFLISSWTRHHTFIWDAMRNKKSSGRGLVASNQQDRYFSVQFTIDLTYSDATNVQNNLSKAFTLDLHAVTMPQSN